MQKKAFSFFAVLLMLVTTFDLKSQQIDPEALYYIVSPSGLVVDNLGSVDDDANLFLRKRQGDNKGQVWRIKALDNGTFQITDPYVQKSLDNGNIQQGNGNPIIQWSESPSNSNQHWTIRPIGTGAVQIQHSVNGMSLGIVGEEKEGTKVYQLPTGFLDWKLEESETRLPKDYVPRGDEEWQNETIFQINKLPGHTTFVPYPDRKSLMADEYFRQPWLQPQSSMYLSLNGQWKFKWSKQPGDRPAEFYKNGYDVSSWGNLSVPSCWEMQGFGTPIYTNITYPFANRPPFITPQKGYTSEKEPNPVGSYRKEFAIPSSWSEQEIILHFDGVYSGFYVWVNGQKIGYSEGANNVTEFNITSAIRKGANILAVEVYKWTDGSYIEDQDMFRFGGIHRDVFLYALPKVHIYDYAYKTDFEGSDFNRGVFDLQIKLAKGVQGIPAGWKGSVQMSLLDQDQQVVATQMKKLTLSDSSTPLRFEQTMDSPRLWSAETPYLYTLVLVLLDEKGKETQVVSSKVGFRKIEIRDKRVFVNGKQIFFKGVNRHDTHPESGKTIPVEAMLKDVIMMKQHNINTLRTSHYPNSPKMYAILDYYGLYTMDEADIENHGNHSISDRESWKEAYLDRIDRLVLRDRNHPSVIFWSLGNESGNGHNFEDMYARAKSLDPQKRPIHYEGKNEVADIDSHMYPSIENMFRFDQRDSDKPYFLCEYVHSMGNAMGNLQEYWDYIENNSQRMIGGCIWDWADQSHIKPGGPKDKFYYGGDFGEKPTDGDFSNDGLTTPDRRVTAKLIEVKKVYQYIKITPYALVANKIALRNKYDFTDLNQFSLYWEVTKDGLKVQDGSIDTLSAAPDASTIVTLPLVRSFDLQSEYHLNVYLRLKADASWAQKGHIVASEQFALTPRKPVGTIDLANAKQLKFREEAKDVEIAGVNFSVIFDRFSGQMISLKYGNREVVKDGHGLQFNWYRSVNNDKYTEQDYFPTDIKTSLFHATMDSTGKFVTLVQNSTAHIHAKLDVEVPYTIKYVVYGDGKIDVDGFFTLPKNADAVRRLGLQMQVMPSLDSITYFGHGPHENYSDRIQSAFVGRYRTNPRGMEEEHYIRAQSMGNREGIRWVSLVDKDQKGIRIVSKDRMSFSALNFSDEAVWKAKHDFDLDQIRQPSIYLSLDAVQQGLGNATCGPMPLQQYMIPVHVPTFYSFRIEPQGW